MKSPKKIKSPKKRYKNKKSKIRDGYYLSEEERNKFNNQIKKIDDDSGCNIL